MTPFSIHAEKKHKKSHNQDGANHEDHGSPIQEQKRISNMVKLSTSILKSIIDSTTIDHSHDHQERCLIFTKQYTKFLIFKLKQHSHGLLEFKEDDLKETFLCLKTSFTYAAKLVNIVLTNSSESSPVSTEPHNLSNSLFDLIVSVEEHLGPRYGSLLLSPIKLWLPDLILALSSQTKFGLTSWVLTLAKIELFDQQVAYSDEVVMSSKFSTFRKVIELMVQLLRANRIVLDSVGAFLLDGLVVGLNKKEFELVFGILNFVFVKLVKHENGEWVGLKVMLENLERFYPLMERVVDEVGHEREKEWLERGKMLVEPVWRCYVGEDLKEPMETGFCES